MPAKGDLTDFVEAHPDFSTDELISRLESAIPKGRRDTKLVLQGSLIAQAIEAESQQKLTVESREKSQERLSELPNWSQSDLAFWLAEKYRSKLAWNTEQQQWYRYGAQTEGIWSIEPVEFVGQLVKSEVEAIAIQFN